MGSPTRAEAVRARLEIRLEDRFQHQFEGRLHHPVTGGGDTQPAQLAAGLGDHPLTDRQRLERAGLQVGSQSVQERFGAAGLFDVSGGFAVHTSSPSAPVASDPVPPNQQKRRVTNEVVKVVEPTLRIGFRPLMQLGLDLQCPGLGLFEARPRRARVHRRPPGIPTLLLLTRWVPSPCTQLSCARTTTDPPPRPGIISRRSAFPPPTWPVGGEGDPGTIPTFAKDPLTGAMPSFSPDSLSVAKPQALSVISLAQYMAVW